MNYALYFTLSQISTHFDHLRLLWHYYLSEQLDRGCRILETHLLRCQVLPFSLPLKLPARRKLGTRPLRSSEHTTPSTILETTKSICCKSKQLTNPRPYFLLLCRVRTNNCRLNDPSVVGLLAFAWHRHHPHSPPVATQPGGGRCRLRECEDQI